MAKILILPTLKEEASLFSSQISGCRESSLYGVTDGKAVGTYLENKFQDYLESRYSYIRGSTAQGIDFPELTVDIKTTSIRQPPNPPVPSKMLVKKSMD